MARRSFDETFRHHYDDEPFDHFLDSAYGVGGRMDRDLHDTQIDWLVAFHETDLIGYAKLTPLRAPAVDPLPGALELQQIYVLSAWHGRGISDELIRWAIGEARARQAPELYLTVFDHNHRAKRFYLRHGFGEVGRCTFALGDRIDDDRIWRRRL